LEEIRTMLAFELARRLGSRECVTINTEVRFTSSMRCQSSNVVSVRLFMRLSPHAVYEDVYAAVETVHEIVQGATQRHVRGVHRALATGGEDLLRHGVQLALGTPDEVHGRPFLGKP